VEGKSRKKNPKTEHEFVPRGGERALKPSSTLRERAFEGTQENLAKEEIKKEHHEAERRINTTRKRRESRPEESRCAFLGRKGLQPLFEEDTENRAGGREDDFFTETNPETDRRPGDRGGIFGLVTRTISTEKKKHISQKGPQLA